MTPEETLEKIRAQNRARAKRYYEANQAKISVKRKEAREECKTCKEDKAKEPPKKVKLDLSKTKLSRELTTTHLQDNIESESSKKFYGNTLKTLEDILDCADFNKCLKNSASVIYKIENATQKKDPSKVYSINSKKGLYQCILKLVDTLDIKISKNARDAYIEKFESHNLESRLNTKERVVTESVMDFDEYLEKVKEKFGENSKEFVIASLYDLSGFRDDLTLKVVSTKPKETKENYIVIPMDKKKNLTIELNAYKTASKYGQDIIAVPRELSKLIRQYMESNSIGYSEYLLGSKPLSGFITKFNKKMGLNISINKLRQMRVSKILNNNPTIEQRRALAKEMKHSGMTSLDYQRLLKQLKLAETEVEDKPTAKPKGKSKVIVV